MSHPRSDALDALEYLACELIAVCDLMTTAETCLSEDAVFGLELIFRDLVAKLRAIRDKLSILMPA